MNSEKFELTREFRTPKAGDYYLPRYEDADISRHDGNGEVPVIHLVGTRRLIARLKSVTYTVSGVTETEYEFLGMLGSNAGVGMFGKAVQDA